MSTYEVEPDELRASASDLRTAASSARAADATDAMSALGGALPGSVDDFADGLDAAAADAEAADAAADLFQAWLKKFLGGGP